MGSNNFLSGLTNVLEQQFSVGENKLNSLDVNTPGGKNKYGKLGDFAANIDQTADRSYSEEGWYRNDFYNPRQKNIQYTLQQPDITVLVKKKAFNSLSENFRPDLLSNEERLMLKATHTLFNNKCEQISLYEQLTKLENVVLARGALDYQLTPFLMNIADTGTFLNVPGFDKFKQVVNQVREAIQLSQDSFYTSYIQNFRTNFGAKIGLGTGVIEFNNISNISTSVGASSTLIATGDCNFTIQDPYNLMLITNLDIEKALGDTFNSFYNTGSFDTTVQILQDNITKEKNKLNQLRASRGAAAINFIVNPETFLGKRVRAIIDIIGFEINFNLNFSDAFATELNISKQQSSNNIDPSAKINSEATGNNGLTPSEEALFINIVGYIYSLISTNKNSQQLVRNLNTDQAALVNGVRNKLRLYYGNKLLIQPMDEVHIYINSRTTSNPEATGIINNNLTQSQWLGSLNKSVDQLKDEFNLFNNYSVEKSIFVGNDFPTWAWSIFRNYFVADHQGAHTFGGVVKGATSLYSAESGTFNVSVQCEDMISGYFDRGVVNFQPSVDNYLGPLFDPLTPFDIKFDELTGKEFSNPQLLQENKELLKSNFIKYNNGPYIGRRPNENNYVQDNENIKNSTPRRVYYDPDGTVYKWKDGIGTATVFGSTNATASERTGQYSITRNPFAGQDVMNILSLLISGQPYNFATYYNGALKTGALSRDPITNQDASVSYFKSLRNDLNYRNKIYGNFIPFKKLVVSEESYKATYSGFNTIQQSSEKIKDLFKKKAELLDQQNILQKTDPNNSLNKINDLKQQIADISSKIFTEQNNFQTQLSGQKNIKIFGDDVSLNNDEFLNNQGINTDNNFRKELRKKTHFLTRRLIYKVRSHKDNNLLIIDDQYDKDYDIQGFETIFSTNPSLFGSEYGTVKEKISNVAEMLNLEVFCDTQGHIQIRMPQWNKIPSSVFYTMMQMNKDYGIKLYPTYLEDLIYNQSRGLADQIALKECELRIRAYGLGLVDDASITSFINTNSAGTKFSFITTITGDILGTNTITAKSQSQPDNQEEQLKNYIAGLAQAKSTVLQQSNLNNIFGIETRDVRILTTLAQKNTQGNVDYFDKLKQTWIDKSGISQFNITDFIPNDVSTSFTAKYSVIEQIGLNVKDRQRALTLYVKSINNLEAGVALNTNKDNTANKVLTPSIVNNQIPEILENLIEDESYDDYGPGSGKRYVIKIDKIKSLTYKEQKPTFTAITVNGMFDTYLGKDGISGDLSIAGGNALTSATAVDYDLWRMYGMMLPQTVDAPYLSDPYKQIELYAVSLLNKARQSILSAEIEVVGNEYYQPGDVVYIEHLDLLFYVENVRHTFDYNRSFSTGLTLTYGHCPGQYIPTPLDIIGKVLYNNKELSKNVNIKQTSSYNEYPIGALYYEQDITVDPIDLLVDDYPDIGNLNSITLAKIIDQINGAWTSASDNNSVRVELRYYYNSSTTKYSSAAISSNIIAEALQDFLKNPGKSINKLNLPNKINLHPAQNVLIIPQPIDCSETSPKTTINGRSPSKDAFYISRQKNTSNNSSSSNNKDINKIDDIIYNNIIDCWIVYQDNSDTNNINNSKAKK